MRNNIESLAQSETLRKFNLSSEIICIWFTYLGQNYLFKLSKTVKN